jgi:putative mRNA 3-end processing factor
MTLLRNTECGLYCEAGNFYVDPWRPVDFAVVTHGHSDHARWGSKQYLTAESGKEILRARLGADAVIETLKYGESIYRDGVRISLHPAGHILGSAQVRLELGGEVCVVSGDYKIQPDGACEPFEPVRCHHFVTESTFGLPIFRWRPQEEIFRQMNQWWRENQARECTSVLFCYALGKAQRLLKGLDASLGPIFVHGAIERFLPAYRQANIALPETIKADGENVKQAQGRGIVLAPGSADNSPWLRKFGDVSTAFASGWMQMRGPRRRRSLDRGFVLSDHADWDELCATVRATGAEKVWVTHGYTGAFARHLCEQGLQAEGIETRFVGELEDEPEKPSAAEPSAAESPPAESAS